MMQRPVLSSVVTTLSLLAVSALIACALGGCATRGADDRIEVSEADRELHHGASATVVASRRVDRARLSPSGTYVLITPSGEEPVYVTRTGIYHVPNGVAAPSKAQHDEILQRLDAMQNHDALAESQERTPKEAVRPAPVEELVERPRVVAKPVAEPVVEAVALPVVRSSDASVPETVPSSQQQEVLLDDAAPNPALAAPASPAHEAGIAADPAQPPASEPKVPMIFPLDGRGRRETTP